MPKAMIENLLQTIDNNLNVFINRKKTYVSIK